MIVSVKHTAKLLTGSLLAIVLMIACHPNDNPIDYDKLMSQITVKYDSIRSYPAGGGIFLVKYSPYDNSGCNLKVSFDADEMLNVKLSKTVMNQTDTIIDITVAPSQSILPGSYYIRLAFSSGDFLFTKTLKVVVYEWSGNTEDALLKLRQFKPWFESNLPDLKLTQSSFSDYYATYPQTLIVEHHSYLTDDLEIRLCYHVMIPPYDWSMLSVRSRNSFYPYVALKYDSEGNITQIPVQEYPTLYGY